MVRRSQCQRLAVAQVAGAARLGAGGGAGRLRAGREGVQGDHGRPATACLPVVSPSGDPHKSRPRPDAQNPRQ